MDDELNLTLVAFYGTKPPAMSGLFRTLQSELQHLLGEAFTAYDMEQVHSTLVGLEGRRSENGIRNTNFFNATGKCIAMDLEGLFNFFLDTPLLPMQIRIGGFERSRTYPFESRNLHPYVRSFSISHQHAVVMGWPTAGETYPILLDNLRRQCFNYNVLHKYHTGPGAIDNDLYFVLGRIDSAMITEEKAVTAQQRVRKLLAAREPFDTQIGPAQISVVAYRDRQLPRSSSSAYTLAEARDEPWSHETAG